MTTFATLEDAWGVTTFGAQQSYGSSSIIPVRRRPVRPAEAAGPRMLRAPDHELKQALRRSVLEARERHGIAGVARLLGPDLVQELCSAAGGGGAWWDLQAALDDPETLLKLLVAAFAVLVVVDLLK